MFGAIIDWFDRHYSPVVIDKNPQPPAGTLNFVVYFVRQFRTAIAIRLVTVAATALGRSWQSSLLVGSLGSAAVEHPVAVAPHFLADLAVGGGLVLRQHRRRMIGLLRRPLR